MGGEPNYSVTGVTYGSEGIVVNAWLYEPVGLRDPVPAIVHHPSHRSPARQYEWYLGRFAEAGYVGLAIEQRGYGSGPDGQNDRGGPRQQADVINGVSYLATLPTVDPDRIGVSGHSNGAALALIATARDPRVRACVSLAPKTDWLRALEMARDWKPEFYRQTIQEMSGGIPPDQDPTPYQARSPLTYADRIRVPVLLIVGAQDWVNPSYHCTWMAEALKRCGNANVEVHVIEEVEHFFCRRHFLGYRFEEVAGPAIRWFDRFVKTRTAVSVTQSPLNGRAGA